MTMLKYLKSLIKSNTRDSSKSFSLILSVLSGALLTLCAAFVMIWDVITNGHVITDLDALGIFILCVGGYMAGGGISKVVSDRRRNKQNNDIQDK